MPPSARTAVTPTQEATAVSIDGISTGTNPRVAPLILSNSNRSGRGEKAAQEQADSVRIASDRTEPGAGAMRIELSPAARRLGELRAVENANGESASSAEFFASLVGQAQLPRPGIRSRLRSA
jgi:hypothetical protein